MSDCNFKEIRKQIRNVVKELLSEELAKGILTECIKSSQEYNSMNWTRIEKHINELLGKIDERAKDVQSLLMRQMASALAEADAKAPAPTDVVAEIEKVIDAGLAQGLQEDEL